MYNEFPKLNDNLSKMKMEFEKITDKPFFVKNVTWTTGTAQFGVLDITNIIEGILNNPLIRKPFESCALFRTKLCLMAQVAGTPMHQGIVIMAAVPNGFSTAIGGASNFYRIPSFMCSPHVFLNANESTSVCLEVPFYAPVKLMRSSVPSGLETSNVNGINYSEVYLVVMNPLSAPTSGTTSLTISIHAVFKDSEFYVPHIDPTFITESTQVVNSGTQNWATKVLDYGFSAFKGVVGDYIDLARSVVSKYTGLHNPNNSVLSSAGLMVAHNRANVSDAPTYYEKLDPFSNYDRIVNEPVFNTNVDEMNISHILSKPAYIGTFSVASTDTSGRLLFSRPISPLQTTYGGTAPYNLMTPMEILYGLTSCWRGSLKLHIQASMTNFHFAKILVAKNYSPVLNQLTSHPSLSDIPNLLTDTLEFSSGGQVHTVDLPFYSTLQNIPNTLDYVTNSLQHAMYYIYLLQPLVVNGSVPLNISFNVYISAGPDFCFYGFPQERNYRTIYGPLTGEPEIEEPKEFVPESEVVEAPTVVNNQEQVMSVQEIEDIVDESIMRPIVSIRDLTRRLCPVYDGRIVNGTLSTYTTLLRITDLLGFNNPVDSTQFVPNRYSVLSAIAGLFRGFNGSIKCKIILSGAADYSVYYIPPQAKFGTTTGRVRVATSVAPVVVGAAPNDVDFINNTPSKYDPLGPGSLAITPVPFKTMSDVVPQLNASRRQVIEFAVPNYSPLSFIGDLTYRNSTGNFLCNDLGSIILSITPTAPSDTINVRVFVGTTDEARYGFQSICFPRSLNVRGSPSRIETLQGVATSTGLTTYGTLPSEAPRCYFTSP